MCGYFDIAVDKLQHGAVLYKQPVTGSITCWLPLHLFLCLFVGAILRKHGESQTA
jgi:hypothetical protein